MGCVLAGRGLRCWCRDVLGSYEPDDPMQKIEEIRTTNTEALFDHISYTGE